MFVLKFVLVIFVGVNTLVLCQENITDSAAPDVSNDTDVVTIKVDDHGGNLPPSDSPAPPVNPPAAIEEQEQPQADQPAAAAPVPDDIPPEVTVQPTRHTSITSETSTFPPLVHQNITSSETPTKPSEKVTTIVPAVTTKASSEADKVTPKKPETTPSQDTSTTKKGSAAFNSGNFVLIALSAWFFHYLN